MKSPRRYVLAAVCALVGGLPLSVFGADEQVAPRTKTYVLPGALCLQGPFAGLSIGKRFDAAGIDITAENVAGSNGARVVTFRPKVGAESGVQYRAVVEPQGEKVVMIQFTIWLAEEAMVGPQIDIMKRVYAAAGFPSERDGSFHRYEKGAGVIVAAQSGPRGVQLACNSDSFEWLAPRGK